MTELNCNHDCKNCPAWTLSGQTPCIVINKVLDKLDFQERTARQEWHNAIKEGDSERSAHRTPTKGECKQ